MVYSKFFANDNVETSNAIPCNGSCCTGHDNMIDLSDIKISPYKIQEPDTVQFDNIIVYREALSKFPGIEIKLLKIGKALSNFESNNNLPHVKYGVTDITDSDRIRLSSLNASWQTDDILVATVTNDTLNIKYARG